jgi:hypothetical protein
VIGFILAGLQQLAESGAAPADPDDLVGRAGTSATS